MAPLVVVDLIEVVIDALHVVEEFIFIELFLVVLEVLLEVAASPTPSALGWAARLGATTTPTWLLPATSRLAFAFAWALRQQPQPLLLLRRGVSPEGVQLREVERDVLALPMRSMVWLAISVASRRASRVGDSQAEHIRPAQSRDADPEVSGQTWNVPSAARHDQDLATIKVAPRVDERPGQSMGQLLAAW